MSKFGEGKVGSLRPLSVIVVVNGPRTLGFGSLVGHFIVACRLQIGRFCSG